MRKPNGFYVGQIVDVTYYSSILGGKTFCARIICKGKLSKDWHIEPLESVPAYTEFVFCEKWLRPSSPLVQLAKQAE